MGTNINKAMSSLNLEEEDTLFDLPDLPEFNSSEQNTRSIIGRILNPDHQKVSDVVFDMPRKWQIKDRVRGVALSKDRFQFIFKYELDLEEVLQKGVHCYNQWALVMERWVAKPPPDYLQYVEVWVQLRNMPINHTTAATIARLGEFAGQVVEVAFDPDRTRNKEYERVKIKLDVARPLRRTKLLNLPGGESILVKYDYERLQRRCFTCQSLTHDQIKCPLFLAQKSGVEKESGGGISLLLLPQARRYYCMEIPFSVCYQRTLLVWIL